MDPSNISLDCGDIKSKESCQISNDVEQPQLVADDTGNANENSIVKTTGGDEEKAQDTNTQETQIVHLFLGTGVNNGIKTRVIPDQRYMQNDRTIYRDGALPEVPL